MNLIGEKVRHKKFGTGTIVSNGDCIIVEFDSPREKKRFSVSNNICDYLSFDNVELEQSIKNACLKKEKVLIEEQRRQRCQKHVNSVFQQCKQALQYDSIEEFCDEFQSSLENEVEGLRRNGGRRYQIFDGELVDSSRGIFTYVFETNYELALIDGTEITLYHFGLACSAWVISCQDYMIMCSTYENLGTQISEISFSVESWKLLESLSKRLDDIRSGSSRIATELIRKAKMALSVGDEISAGAMSAVNMATSQPITFIWGPPGTGKTETLANITLQHLKQGKRVLMLSYSNIAVDGAIMRVHKKGVELSAGDIVRYGYPRDSFLLAHEYLTTFNMALFCHPELEKERNALLIELNSIPKNSPRQVSIRSRLTQIRKLLSDEEKDIVLRSRFIATTVSKATVDPSIYEQKFDVVIFDEASMAYIPQIVFSASLAKNHFICIGDFCQLPPIVQDKDSILSKDIFQYCYVTMAIEHNLKHQWLCLLETQYRMHSRIANFVGKHMYYDLLSTCEGVDKQREQIVSGLPIPGAVTALTDLSGFMSLCSKTRDLSYINVLSAFLSCCLAINAATNFSVGIITPYSAQSRLIKAMIRDVAQHSPALKPISAATVHQFQGSEKDVIVFDAVDCYMSRYPSVLLTSTKDNCANRLFNVAMTRARGKFITMVNYDYMKRKSLSKSLLFDKLLSSMVSSPGHIKGRALLGQLIQKNDCLKVYSEQESDVDFLSDMLNAKREIRIDIPAGTSASSNFIKELSNALFAAKSNGLDVTIRTDKKSNLPKELQQLSSEHMYIMNPVAIFDKQIVWFGKPNSNANFIAEGAVLKTQYRPVIRMHGKNTAKQLWSFLNFNDC